MAASLLPNGKQQFIDINGKPLVGGTVGMYVPNTLISKNTWQDADQQVLNSNPITLDSRGQAIIYGSGTYRQIVRDITGNLIWDELTRGTDDVGSNVLDLSTIPGLSPTNTGAQNGDAIRAAIATVSASSFAMYGSPEVYPCAGTVTIPATCLLFEGRGMTLNYHGQGGSYPPSPGTDQGACVVSAGSPTAEPALNTDVAFGAISVTLASAPTAGVVAGSWIRLVDKAVLYNGSRAYYYTGEDAKVLGVSGNTITFNSALKFDYTAAGTVVTLMNLTATPISNFNVIGRGDNTGTKLQSALRIYMGGPETVIQNCSASGSDYCAIEYVYCIGTEVYGGSASSVYDASNTYGSTYVNCTGMKFFGGCYSSCFNAVSPGAADSDYAIVNYNCVLTNPTMNVVQGSSASGYGYAMHGNCLDCECIDFVSCGPVSFSGDNATLIGYVRSGDKYGLLTQSINGSELKSTRHTIECNVDYYGGTENALYAVVVGIGDTAGTAIDANTTAGGTLRIKVNAKYFADFTNGIAEVPIVSIRNNGATPSSAMRIDFSGSIFECVGKHASVTKAGSVFSDVVTGDTFEWCMDACSGDFTVDVQDTNKFDAIPITISNMTGFTSDPAIHIEPASGYINISPEGRGGSGKFIRINGSSSPIVNITSPVADGYGNTYIEVDCGPGPGTGAIVSITGGSLPDSGHTAISISSACAIGFIEPGYYSGAISNSAGMRKYGGQLPACTFAQLPGASFYVSGQRGEITDGAASTFNASAAGGGATDIGVVNRSGAWVYG